MEIRRLHEENSLFEERICIPVSDFENFVAETLLLPSMLQETDLVSFLVLGKLLHCHFQTRDDGSASFFFYSGNRILQILKDPVYVQIRLRYIWGMTVVGMECSTQQERFEKLSQIYLKFRKVCDPALLPAKRDDKQIFGVSSMLGLRILERALYFSQSKERNEI